MDPWTSVGSKLLNSDPKFSLIQAAKKALKIVADKDNPLVSLCLACANNDVFEAKSILSSDSSVANNTDPQGLTPLIYAVCFDKKECVDLLLTLGVDPDTPDTKIGYTPLMWATYFDYTSIVETLVGGGGDPLKRGGQSNQSAVDLANPGTVLYEYYKAHNYVSKRPSAVKTGIDSATKGMGGLHISSNSKSPTSPTARFVDDGSSAAGESMAWEEFDFNSVLPRQSVKVTDDSMIPTVEFAFTLFSKYPSKPIYPATVVFMCMRHADHVANSPETVDNIMDYFATRIRSETGSKSGVVSLTSPPKSPHVKNPSNASSSADIVAICYWIGCLNHLYYFLHRDVSGILRKSPRTLQTIVSTLQPLIMQITFTIDSRLETMIEPCLLSYSSVPDLDIVYKRNWNLFGKHKGGKKNSYQEIVDMLYPPSLDKQMKPSPLKVIQTLGALLYVLELYYINSEIKQQCLAGVIYWLNCSVFNRVCANKKYSSRAKALQIRLNLSYIQDWLRTNNLTPAKPGDINFANDKYPDDGIDGDADPIKSVLRFHKNTEDPMDASFYFNSLYRIGQVLLEPTVQLLQWLQVMTGVSDTVALKDTIVNFGKLNSAQLMKCIKNYDYEVAEPKFPRELNRWLRKYPFDAKVEKGMYYTADSEKLFLNVGQSFPVALPGYTQLLQQYGVELNSVDKVKMRKFQPNLSVEVQDDLDDILDKHGCLIKDVAVVPEPAQMLASPVSTEKQFEDQTRASDLFKSLTMPSGIAHKTWGGASMDSREENPWS